VETFRKGDIVLYPFPYTDLSNRKIRPCLVLSNEINEDVILCQITSKNIISDSYSIELNRDETIEGSLLIDSYIRANMLFTANKFHILKKICCLSNSKYNLVINKILELISK